MITYEPRVGSHVRDTAEKICEMAQGAGEIIQAKFNDVMLVATPEVTPEQLVKFYDNNECEDRRKAYLASPEYRRDQEEAQRKQREKDEALKLELETSPGTLTLLDPAAWREFAANNQDGYGKAVVDYAERWARIMEGRMAKGENLADIAKEASSIADNEGITGFMYGCAVGTLSACWKHGDELRRWHNLDTQIRDEGEKANESGGVLNPALFKIGD